MKKGIILLMWFITFHQVHATIITVDNNMPSIGDFTTLQAAHDAAVDNDTLLLFPSLVTYQAITISKPISIIGNGYYYPFEAQIQWTKINGAITILSDANGTSIQSLEIIGSLDIYASNVIINRNKVEKIRISSGNNILILNNYITGGNFNSVEFNDQTNFSLISNIIISQYSGRSCLRKSTETINNVNITAINNLFVHSDEPSTGASIYIELTANSFINNTIQGAAYGITNSSYNICSGNQLPSTNNNQLNVDMNTVFLDYSTGDYHLKPGSPAVGNGLNGVDIGPYGGDTPFIDNGLPQLPTIYFLNVPFTGSQQTGLPITIKAKSND